MLPEASLTGSVALHSGYSEHPQNSECFLSSKSTHNYLCLTATFEFFGPSISFSSIFGFPGLERSGREIQISLVEIISLSLSSRFLLNANNAIKNRNH